MACALSARGLELTVHTVGFDVDAAARAQLTTIASCTGGEYRDARNAAELGESLRQLTEAGLLIHKERESSAAPQIRGGKRVRQCLPDHARLVSARPSRTSGRVRRLRD